MTFTLKLIGLASGEWTHNDGQFLKAYDPEAHDGRGRIDTTDRLEDAMAFPDAGAALELWKTQSRVRPLRPDGKPNRPLTAYTVEVVQKSR